MDLSMTTGYINARGLSLEKWKTLSREISQYDIYVIAETWEQTDVNLTKHHNYLMRSKSIPWNGYGHRQGGIACFVSARIRQFISRQKVSKYSIQFDVMGHTILSVYLPPSMDVDKFIKRLSPGGYSPSLIIGDINTHFGPRFNTKKTGPPGRISATKDICRMYGLNLLVPIDGSNPGPDHIMALSSLHVRHTTTDRRQELHNDHSFLNIKWILPVKHIVLDDNNNIERFRIITLK